MVGEDRERREGRGDRSVRSTTSMVSKSMVSMGEARRGTLDLDMVEFDQLNVSQVYKRACSVAVVTFVDGES